MQARTAIIEAKLREMPIEREGLSVPLLAEMSDGCSGVHSVSPSLSLCLSFSLLRPSSSFSSLTLFSYPRGRRRYRVLVPRRCGICAERGYQLHEGSPLYFFSLALAEYATDFCETSLESVLQSQFAGCCSRSQDTKANCEDVKDSSFRVIMCMNRNASFCMIE